MTIDGGGWTRMTAEFLRAAQPIAHEYLYTYRTGFYLSPQTTLLWSWSEYQPLEGQYAYGRSGVFDGTFPCTDGETGYWGVGCSNGPNTDWKCFAHGEGFADPAAGRTTICQDLPDVFGVGTCALQAEIWIRP